MTAQVIRLVLGSAAVAAGLLCLPACGKKDADDGGGGNPGGGSDGGSGSGYAAQYLTDTQLRDTKRASAKQFQQIGVAASITTDVSANIASQPRSGATRPAGPRPERSNAP